MSQVLSCSFTMIYYDIDELVTLEVPIHKRWKRVMDYDGFIILSAHKLWCL